MWFGERLGENSCLAGFGLVYDRIRLEKEF